MDGAARRARHAHCVVDMIVAALVPALAFVLLLAVVRPRCPDARTALLAAAVLWGLLVVVVTEVLSLVQALNCAAVLGAWLAVSALLGWQARRGGTTSAWNVAGLSVGGLDRAALVGVAAIALAIGAVALATPPNTYDSMTYHMSRVAHWAQNQSVEHYPTSIARQLSQPPWAEFAILQFYVLTGGDRLANLVQWLSMLGALVGVSLAVRHLGGDRRAQFLAVAVAVTIPVRVVQASGTKNDYVAAFWLMCLAVFVLTLNSQPARARVGGWVVVAGSALGLALLTKASAYIFAVPLVVWACLARIRRDRWKAWPVLIGLVLVAAAINAPYMARNVERYGFPLGPVREGPYEYANASLGVRSTISVAVRNAGLHLGTPWESVNALTLAVIRAIHRALGLNLDDPATTWRGTHFEVSGPKRHEDMVSNGLHLALIAVTLLALATRPELRTPDRVRYTTALVVAFLLFCVVLRWQPWHSRLHLPLFVLWAPLIGIVLARRPRVGALVVAGLAAVAVVIVLANEPRPLVGVLREPREALYFRNRPGLRRPYTEAVKLLAERGCARIGLQLGSDDWEYPLWVLVRSAIPGVRLEHVEDQGVPDRASERPDARALEPCAIIATQAPERTEFVRQGALYRRVFSAPPVGVFLREAAGSAR